MLRKLNFMPLLVGALTVTVSAVVLPAAADNTVMPAQYRENCTACHSRMTGGDGRVLYTRKDRLVQNLKQLKERVDYCRRGVGLDWSSAEIMQTVTFLDRHFYRF